MKIHDLLSCGLLVNEVSAGFVPLTESHGQLPESTTPARDETTETRSAELLNVLHNINEHDLIQLPPTGLAHDHVRLGNTKYLLRIPKQSQMRLGAQDNLHYQAACFQRMHPSGHTPQCFGTVAPATHLPMGCLVVEYIDGRPLRLPSEINRAADALAAIHCLVLPEKEKRLPLLNQHTPLHDTFLEVLAQGEYVDQSHCGDASKKAIKHQLALAKRDIEQSGHSPITLTSFDAHPGNFLIDSTGKAYLVDLEKARYGGAGFDLAHATLYTSTTWDEHCHCILTQAEIDHFYASWSNAMPVQLSSALQPQLLPMRRLMWLWSLTWCAKWTVQSKTKNISSEQTIENAENWSADNSSASLIQHVQERVNHYLDIETIDRISQEFE